MTKPKLFDVVELLVNLPDSDVQAGELGTIVEEYGNTDNHHAYEVEFANSEGKTIETRTLTPDQFMVVWRSATKAWIPLGDRLASLLENLPEERQEQVLSFVRSLYKTPA